MVTDNEKNTSNGDQKSANKKRQEYDGSEKPRVYPNSLETLAQVKNGLNRLDLRASWIASERSTLEEDYNTSSDNDAKLVAMEEDITLCDELASLKKTRVELNRKKEALLAERSEEIANYQFESIDW